MFDKIKNFAVSHWEVLAAGFVGIIVLYYLVEQLGGASAGAAPAEASGDATSGSSADQVQSLSAAADLTNAQVNGQVEVAAYTAQSQDEQVDAALQASLAQTAATAATAQQTNSTEAAVALGEASDAVSIQTIQSQQAETVNEQNVQGAVDVASDADTAAVNVQKLQSNQAVTQTQIEGDTLDTLGSDQVKNYQIQAGVVENGQNAVASQIANLATYSKHFNTDIQAIAPVIAEEEGEQTAAVGTANADASVQNTKTTTSGQEVSAGISGVTGILGALFA